MIRGTSHDQDFRFADKNKKMLNESKWPDKYSIKIDLSKVDLQIIEMWIAKRVESLLKEEDDIVSGTIVQLLEEAVQKEQPPSAKQIHVAISGFLSPNTLTFMMELWDHLDEAQKSTSGIPQSLIEHKKHRDEEQRQKLQENEKKRKKIQSYKFKQTIHRHARRRSRSRSNKDRRENSRRHKYSRSRSRDRRKHRRRRDSRSRSDKRRRNRSRSEHGKRDKDRSKYSRHDKRQRSASQQSSSVQSSDSN